MSKKKIVTVVGTRPNLIKITQFDRVVAQYGNLEHILVHTGQHFDRNMNDVFFEELQLRYPDHSLAPSKETVVKQIAGIMSGLEDIFKQVSPDLVLVVGDVNSTLAAGLVANKMQIKMAHVESGLRSFDRSMPEEHNRMVTDAITDWYFVTEKSGLENLIHEGKSKDSILFSGNTMIDTLVAFDLAIRKSTILKKLNAQEGKYVLMTMHRPGNVDSLFGLQKVIDLIHDISQTWDVIFPIHPRTLNNLKNFGLLDSLEHNQRVILTEPAGYLDFQQLILHSALVITDSGGIQEETTFRQVPCITLRPNTERPITVEIGSNVLMDFDNEKILQVISSIQSGEFKKGEIPERWDGKSTERIFEFIHKNL
ncbi:MAG: UDP-N-acetylglucosamine 2-epimerase (non-hydrolyzing) [Cytophagales bacterium]|nr:UDP-N-acetylglucosamine 2-epimerase (non-hydrolyzing) [Cytophagales bacterium]